MKMFCDFKYSWIVRWWTYMVTWLWCVTCFPSNPVVPLHAVHSWTDPLCLPDPCSGRGSPSAVRKQHQACGEGPRVWTNPPDEDQEGKQPVLWRGFVFFTRRRHKLNCSGSLFCSGSRGSSCDWLLASCRSSSTTFTCCRRICLNRTSASGLVQLMEMLWFSPA